MKFPNENHFAITPQNRSPANDFRSDDCNELLAKELAALNENCDNKSKNLVSQSSIEIMIRDDDDDKEDAEKRNDSCDIKEGADVAEVKKHKQKHIQFRNPKALLIQ